MVEISASAVGHEMSVPHERDAPSKDELITVKCDFAGVRVMSRVEGIDLNPEKKYTVTQEQFKALQESGIRFRRVDPVPLRSEGKGQKK
ncbi:MAG: hypothetical protein LVQ95_00965 [Candidatus Micrarchaeales archaeon]|nr:hypothetical protein [Candidatus Micrarchaeales archaeon]